MRERLAREAAGNPLFLQELARVARDPGDALPPTLLAAVQLEVGAMPPAARALLDGAAVAGDPFDPELAAAAAGLDAADALRRRSTGSSPPTSSCATGDGRAFRFRHPLLRRAVYDAAPPAWRLAAHERVAAALSARGAGASVRAFHVEKCARPGDEGAVALLAEAAAAAAGTAPATAARWYAAGARLLPHAERAQRAGLLGPMALSLANAGRLQREPRRAAGRARAPPVRAHPGAARRSSPRPPASSTCSAATATRAGGCWPRSRTRRPRAAPRSRSRWPPPATTRATPPRCATGAPAPSATPTARTRCAPAPRASARSAPSAPATPTPPRRCSTARSTRLARIEDPAIAAGLKGAIHVATAALLGERFEDGYATLDRALSVARATRQDGMLGRLAITRAQLQQQRLNIAEALADVEVAEEGARLQGVSSMLHQRSGRRRSSTTTAARAPRPSAPPRSPPSCSTSSRPARSPARAAAPSPRSTRSRIPSAASAR